MLRRAPSPPFPFFPPFAPILSVPIAFSRSFFRRCFDSRTVTYNAVRLNCTTDCICSLLVLYARSTVAAQTRAFSAAAPLEPVRRRLKNNQSAGVALAEFTGNLRSEYLLHLSRPRTTVKYISGTIAIQEGMKSALPPCNRGACVRPARPRTRNNYLAFRRPGAEPSVDTGTPAKRANARLGAAIHRRFAFTCASPRYQPYIFTCSTSASPAPLKLQSPLRRRKTLLATRRV